MGRTVGTVVAQATSSTTSAAIRAANSARQGATIFNDSTADLYVLLGTGTASATNYSVKMAPGSYYEVPYGFTGALTGVWSAANGFAYITELV